MERVTNGSNGTCSWSTAVADSDPEIFFRPRNLALTTELGTVAEHAANQSINAFEHNIDVNMNL